MLRIRHKGTFQKTKKLFEENRDSKIQAILERYAKVGIDALYLATPVDSGETARSWGYEIQKTKNGFSIVWTNSNIVDGVPVAILLQYGHATNSGGYVEGRDYINPALRPIFDRMAADIWKEVAAV